ncbi:glycosyltransferase family 2 protein [Sphingosinicella sp. CPCC 101087]|uniref:glycosyltransferase family 2 protein n=1 Tax=Sphingosinicella sp. CPCC 101087 TaxID=2497754 RepID=UPI00101DF0AE|nr:glycosyltransferase family 2 protein [Sphingosinicella sp. CPCC 101087]
MSTLFSVIIPIYRDWGRLALCLAALERQTLPLDRFEILIANNEPDGKFPLAHIPSNARIVHQPRPGSYAARNAAVAAAQGEYLAFTDSDCIPDPKWMANGLAALRANPGARVTGPIAIFREAGSSYYAFLYDLHTAFPQSTYVSHGQCPTANLLVEKRIWEKVGPFDECFSGGDTLWSQRAQKIGVPLMFDEKVAVGHPARRSVADILKKGRRVAGSMAKDRRAPPYRFFFGRLKPPRPSKLPFDRNRLGLRDWLALFLIFWTKGAVEAVEFGSVYVGLKLPNRM